MADDPNNPPQVNMGPPNLASLPNAGPTAQDVLQNLPRLAQQSQQPDQASQGLDAADQFWQQQLKDNTPQPATGGPVRRLLQNFFSGMGNSMMHEGGLQTPYDKQQQAVTGLQGVANAKGALALHQQMASQYAPVPLVGMDGKPIVGPDGSVIALPANHAQTFYAGQAAAAGRIQIQGMKNDSAETIQGMKNDAASPIMTPEQAQAIGHPELAGQEVGKAYSGLLAQLSRNSTAETIARGHDLARIEATKMQMAARANLAKDPNALTNTMKTMKQQAISTLPGIDRALEETQKVAGMLGPVSGRWNDFWQGKVGASDPTFAHYKDEIAMVSSAVTLAHARGRMSNELFEHFQRMFDAGKQSPENMTQALNVAKEWLGEYATMGGGNGSAPTAPKNGPSDDPFAQFGGKKR